MRRAWTVLLIGAALASGQASKDAAARRQAILDYKLDMKRANQLITAMTAMTRYVASLPDFAERVKKAATMTPAEQLAQIEKDPKAAAILKDNGLTAQDYIIGVPALRMALLTAQGVPAGDRIIASPANMAFAKANLAELKPKMDAADGTRSK